MASLTLGFASSPSGRSRAAQYVFSVGDSFKVLRIATQPVPAQVIQDKARRNFSVRKFISDAMGSLRFHEWLAPHPNAAVAPMDRCSGPYMATTFGVDNDTGGDPIRDGQGLFWHIELIAQFGARGKPKLAPNETVPLRFAGEGAGLEALAAIV